MHQCPEVGLWGMVRSLGLWHHPLDEFIMEITVGKQIPWEVERSWRKWITRQDWPSSTLSPVLSFQPLWASGLPWDGYPPLLHTPTCMVLCLKAAERAFKPWSKTTFPLPFPLFLSGICHSDEVSNTDTYCHAWHLHGLKVVYDFELLADSITITGHGNLLELIITPALLLSEILRKMPTSSMGFRSSKMPSSLIKAYGGAESRR